MNDLFSTSAGKRPKPLAEELRPRNISDIIGQEHLLAKGSELYRRITSRRLGSILLYGPPGIGKTSIGRAISASMNKEFRSLHSAHSGVADIRKLMDEANMKDLVVFIDEAHRYSKTQMDALLSASESGLFDLIMATTENPYININGALLSRSRIFTLRKLEDCHLEKLIEKAIKFYRDEGVTASISKEATDIIIRYANGDGRMCINIIESIMLGREPGHFNIDTAVVDEIMSTAPLRFDKQGDLHYDVTSAFCKSMRGGDEDGTLLWLAALIMGGVDPVYIARRIMAHASEDVGLADNSALASAEAAMTAATTIGLPECGIILSHAALHVCRAPKSNSAYRALNLAMKHIELNGMPDVPANLRDTHYKGADKLGHVGYLFPHDYEDGWVKQPYLPKDIPKGSFYQSDARDNPSYEAKADEYWNRKRDYTTARTFRRSKDD